MTNYTETLEQDVLDQLRREYEKKGYKFLVEPRADKLPSFLEGFTPDAIAFGDGENVVIELKSTESSADQSASVKFLAREVPKHKGWRFQLVIADRQFDKSDASAEPSERQMNVEFEKVKGFVGSGEYNVALITGWALLEAITRKLILTQRSGEAKRYLPRTVVETLVSEGFLEDDVGTRLLAIANVRNRIVHGYTGLTTQKSDIETLVSAIERLLRGLGK